jgi:hypothetical protein
MRAEYNTLDGMQVVGGVRDGTRIGDTVVMPMPASGFIHPVGDPSEDSTMYMRTRTYRVVDMQRVAILEEVNK